MKAKTLSLCAGIGGAMLLADATPAAFTGIEWESKTNDFGVFVVNVYALFDNTADVMVAIAGTPLNPLNVEVIGGTFYQHAFGNDQAPSAALVAAFPSLAYDTFVTIGKKTSTDDQTGLTPNWPGFGASVLPTDPVDATNIGWFITPDAPQGVPIEGRVLIGQYGSADLTEGPDSGIQGEFLLQAVSDGDPNFQEFVNFTTIPAPGSLALLGLAAIGLRRRRK